MCGLFMTLALTFPSMEMEELLTLRNKVESLERNVERLEANLNQLDSHIYLLYLDAASNQLFVDEPDEGEPVST